MDSYELGNLRVLHILMGGDLMEKKYKSVLADKNLSDYGYQAMLWRTVGAVRRKAQTIPIFRDSHNGCIRITVVPLTQDADEWLGGGLSGYFLEPNGNGILEIPEREFVFKIDPRGSYTIQYVCEDGHTEPVNCYGYSALKTAWALDQHRRRKAGDSSEPYMGYFIEENGWSTHCGVACTTITLNGEDFIDLCVCTSGAKSSEDKECSLAGILEAQRWFETHFASIGFDPYIDDMNEPLEQIWQNE